jgi:hypothetical protein
MPDLPLFARVNGGMRPRLYVWQTGAELPEIVS